MDNRRDDYPGGQPPGGGINNNMRGGPGLPNMFSPNNPRGIDPQYAAALDIDALRLRHQLEVQHDIELRRRLMEEQQHQLISELEYRNKIQQLQELQELQAQQEQRRQQEEQQRQQQAQQQGLSQLLAQNPQLLELHQQQQQFGGRENSLLSSLRDDFLLQRHQMMLQDQMQQQIQEQIARDSQRQQQNEQEELLAMLQASQNLRGAILPSEVTSQLRQQQLEQEAASIRKQSSFEQQQQGSPSVPRPRPPPAVPTPVQQLEHILNNSNRQGADSIQNDQQGRTPIHQQPPDSMAKGPPKKRVHGASIDALDERVAPPPATAARPPPQDSSVPITKKPKPVRESPSKKPVKPHSTKKKDAATANGKKSAGSEKKQAVKDKVIDQKVAKLLESQKLPATKLKDKAEKKGRKKKRKAVEELSASKKGGAKKKALAKSKEDIMNLTDQEQSVINFLGSRGKSKNGKSKKGKLNGLTTKDEKNGTIDGQGKEVKSRNDDEAADIILKFKGFHVPASEVKKAVKWSGQNRPRATTYPVVPPEKIPFISPGVKFNIPSLPIEPELTDFELANMGPLITQQQPSSIMTESTNGERNVSRSTRILSQPKIFKPRKNKAQDNWWPSAMCIRKERRKLGERQDVEDTDDEAEATGDATKPEISFVKACLEATKERLAKSVEPGVMEKLPHCKLYSDFCKEKGKSGEPIPKFCCQTTETFPFEAMVCCSVCSTWRHAQCGGHHKRYTEASIDPSNVIFQPVCDQCYLEKEFVQDNPVATSRLDRQRTEHLRRCNATNAVMRQVAFGKHSGQYKWPLGSVSISHISGHTRSVQARHEKAEKQWGEMANRLGNGQELRPRERQRVRTREFERLLTSVEDAEGAMDRHNMTLFLQRDTSKLHPAGFQVPRRNIFDPEDDPVYVPLNNEEAKPEKNQESAKNSDSSGSLNPENGSKTKTNNLEAIQSNMNGLAATTTDSDSSEKLDDAASTNKSTKGDTCARVGCNEKPRFDSIFCSDSCGVSTLEIDLLRTLQYASKIHPVVLRS